LPSRRPRTRFQDIIFNIEAIRRYTQDLNKHGNLLRHEYDMIRRDDLWAIVRRDLSSLHRACVKAIAALDRREG
jgi:uncharacterized protein with HEPN domain